MATRTKTSSIDINIAEVGELLARIKAQIPADDYARVEGLARTVIELEKQVRQKGATIAGLRRLLGWSSSEKTADVLGRRAAASSGKDEVSPARSDGASHDAPDVSGDADAEHRADGAQEHEGAQARRKGHGKIPARHYQDARHVAVGHECLRVGDGCPECARGKLYRLSEPATFVRIVGQAPLVALCWDCERLRCGGCGHVFTALAPQEAQGPKYASSAASMMALLRYGAGMPLHRLERLERNLGTPLPASTQWEVVRDRVDAVVPVYNELRRRAAEGSVLHNDDTHARILELMGKRRADLEAAGKLDDPERTGLFTTGVVATTSAGPIVLFFTGRKHAGENLQKLLADRKDGLAPPIQMCDGLGRNVPKGREIIESNCLAHGRRHIVDEVGNFPAQCRHVLEELGKVFKNEATCREQGLSGDERLAFHQKESSPVMAELEKWMKTELEEKRVEPNSGLGQAFDYLLKRWNKLTLFLRIPDAPLENNICERALKMAIRHRNNSLFYRSALGAHVGDIYMALIYTADLHAENAFDYLTTLFDNERDVAAHPAAWLPWTYRATLAARGAQRAA